MASTLGRVEPGLGWAGLGWAGLGWAGLGWLGAHLPSLSLYTVHVGIVNVRQPF